MVAYYFLEKIKSYSVMMKFKTIVLLFFSVLLVSSNCKKKSSDSPPVTPPSTGASVEYWITTGNKTKLLQKQTTALNFSDASNTNPSIIVDSASQFQSVLGFGYTLTGGSAYLINRLSASEKSALLQELFGNGENSIKVSYLRVSIGASDLSAEVFSYNDLPTGQTDVNLTNFSLSKDTVDVIPLLQQILAINPSIKIMGSPWSAPVWMKDNGNSIGGSLQTQYYGVYANYFVKYIQAMQAKGIPIDAVTVQNEPQHGGNNPSMVMSATQQADFVKNHLGPKFQTAGITTKIIIWDHNCDNPNYPITIMNDAAAKQFVSGTAFHLYAGQPTALSTVKGAHPEKDLYFTEQWTGANSSFDGDLKWHIKNVVIGTLRNWSRVVLEWNLANDGAYNPHTPGGCTECKGALTLDGAINRNVSFYIIGQISKFVPAGSIRINSSFTGSLFSVAFVTPAGKKVLIVLNEGATAVTFNIKYNNKNAVTSLEGGAVATYTW
jgi:glucosylceramidase